MFWDGPATKRRGGDTHYLAFVLGEERFAIGGTSAQSATVADCACVAARVRCFDDPNPHPRVYGAFMTCSLSLSLSPVSVSVALRQGAVVDWRRGGEQREWARHSARKAGQHVGGLLLGNVGGVDVVLFSGRAALRAAGSARGEGGVRESHERRDGMHAKRALPRALSYSNEIC